MISQTVEDRLLRSSAVARSLLAWLAAALLCLEPAADLVRMQASLSRHGGTAATFGQWRQLIEASRTLEVQDRLRRINEFFNRKIQFADDSEIWGQTDYWATPLETLAKARGDCEDFAIAKYFTLLDAGVPNEQLRLVYVKARIGGPASNVTQAHMVLAFYATPDAEPMILDNLITEIRPASRRGDLQPIFSFNSQGIWSNPTASGVPGSTGVGRLTRWQDLLNRAKAEGFEF